MSAIASASLTPVQVAMLPNHDPMVGRTVGSMMMWQEAQDKPARIVVRGQMDEHDQVMLTYARQADQSVTCDGYVGPVEVHEKITGQATHEFFGNPGLFFGVGGPDTTNIVASVNGTVGGQKEELTLTVDRQSADMPLTEDLKARGQNSMKWGTKVGISPSFGGDFVPVNYNANSFPTASVPVQTEDTYFVQGKLGDHKISRYLSWNTTAWTVSSNTRDGWGYTEFFTAEDGAFGQRVENKLMGQASYPSAVHFEVGRNKATASGKLTVQGPSGEQSLDTQCSYERVAGKGVVEVRQQVGEHKLSFSIYPEGSVQQ